MNKGRPLLFSLLLVIPLIVVSWVIIHLSAVFGVFLSLAYPIWWLYVPNHTVCLLCRANRNGSKCLFCHRQINKKEDISPTSLSSAVWNGVLILVFSVVSLGVVFGESKIL